MDLDISMRTVDCFFTVTFYGALFREVKNFDKFDIIWRKKFNIFVLLFREATIHSWDVN